MDNDRRRRVATGKVDPLSSMRLDVAHARLFRIRLGQSVARVNGGPGDAPCVQIERVGHGHADRSIPTSRLRFGLPSRLAGPLGTSTLRTPFLNRPFYDDHSNCIFDGGLKEKGAGSSLH